MKRLFALAIIISIAATLISWGALGHRTVAIIAEHHLSPKTKTSIPQLLGEESLTEVSTWADEVRGQSQYRSTGPWHYINLPSGLSRSEFDKQITSMKGANIYEAFLRMQRDLTSPATTREQKIIALKWIVHLVGDLHQPMHVSRAEDQGGNKVQVNFNGKGTNLHSLWDSRLLEHGGLSEGELAKYVDHATPAQVKQWQKDPILQWIWESYQVSSGLYAEVAQMKNRTITEQYYKAHLPIIEERLEKAGIRLAGVLNQIFESESVHMTPAAPRVNGQQPSMTSSPPKKINIAAVGNHIGEVVNICDKVYGWKDLKSMMLVNLGADYPNQLLTIVLRGQAKKLQVKAGQMLCATGELVLYKGKPQIIVNDPSLITTSK